MATSACERDAPSPSRHLMQSSSPPVDFRRTSGRTGLFHDVLLDTPLDPNLFHDAAQWMLPRQNDLHVDSDEWHHGQQMESAPAEASTVESAGTDAYSGALSLQEPLMGLEQHAHSPRHSLLLLESISPAPSCQSAATVATAIPPAAVLDRDSQWRPSAILPAHTCGLPTWLTVSLHLLLVRLVLTISETLSETATMRQELRFYSGGTDCMGDDAASSVCICASATWRRSHPCCRSSSRCS